MLSFSLTLLLIFTTTKAGAYEDVDWTEVSGREPAPKVNIVDPGSNIIAKLDCPGCPFVIGRGGKEELVSRPNSLVRLPNADETCSFHHICLRE